MRKHLLTLISCCLLMACLTTELQAQKNTMLVHQFTYDDGLSDIWGYVDENGREYALVGLNRGTSIVDVTNPVNPKEIDRIPGRNSTWRDLKTWGHYAYVVDDQAGESLIIIDLSDLPNSISHTTWTGRGNFSFTTAHNIFIDENGIAYLFGGDINSVGGAVMLDLNTDPQNPTVVGSYDERYVHDGYVRGDTLWTSEINDGLLSVVDISDKANPVVLGQTSTPNRFTHNCWLSDDGKTIFTTDERDDSYVAAYDVSDVTDIKELDRIQSSPGDRVVPHNTFVLGNFLATSYYADGLLIHDATDPSNLIEVGYYDTNNLNGGGTNGAWGVYPYLPSGFFLVTDMNDGLFIIQPFLEQAGYLHGTATNKDSGALLEGVLVSIDGEEQTNRTNFMGEYRTGAAVLDVSYSVTFSKAGYQDLTIDDVVLSAGNITNLDVELQPLPNFTLTGVAMGSDGALLSNANVSLNSELFNYDVTTNASGEFSIPTVFEDTYSLIVGQWGYRTTAINPLALTVSSEPVTVILERGYYDDFSLDFGWTALANEFGSGDWENVVPIPGASFPGGPPPLTPRRDVETDFGDQCFVTGNEAGGFFDNPIIGGTSTLISPMFDLTDYIDPYLSYYSWFTSISNFGQGADAVVIKLSNGMQTVTLEEISYENDPSPIFPPVWAFKNFKVNDFITPTAQMQLLIEAEIPSFNVDDYTFLEAGIDVFQVIDSAGVVSVEQAIDVATNIQVSPNPFTEQVNIHIPNFTTLTANGTAPQLRIVDVTGRTVYSQVVTAEQTVIQRQNWAAGTYLYYIEQNNQAIATGKLMIVD